MTINKTRVRMVSDTVPAVLATMAALRAATPGQHDYVWLAGYYSYGDDGGGVFRWDAVSTAADDAGVVIQPNAGGTGRWIRATGGAIPNVRWWGAALDWNTGTSTGTDDSPAFIAAVAWAKSVGGAEIMIPAGVRIALAQTITIADPNISFVAIGAANTRHNVGINLTQTSTAIFWAGATDGAIFVWTSTAGADKQVLVGGGLRGVGLFGRNVAGYGTIIYSQREAWYKNLYYEGFRQTSFAIGVLPGGINTVEPADSQDNVFENITINQLTSPESLGDGMHLFGYVDATIPNGGANASLNTFRNLEILHQNGHGLVDSGGDNNNFFNTRIGNFGTGSGYAIIFEKETTGPGTDYPCNSERFYGYLCGASLVKTGCTAIQIFAFDSVNGASPPGLEAGAQASWITTTGNIHGMTLV